MLLQSPATRFFDDGLIPANDRRDLPFPHFNAGKWSTGVAFGDAAEGWALIAAGVLVKPCLLFHR